MDFPQVWWTLWFLPESWRVALFGTPMRAGWMVQPLVVGDHKALADRIRLPTMLLCTAENRAKSVTPRPRPTICVLFTHAGSTRIPS